MADRLKKERKEGFLAGRRPADAGLLGVLGSPMSGPGLHPARPAADAAGSLASPKQRFTLREKRSLPRHLRTA